MSRLYDRLMASLNEGDIRREQLKKSIVIVVDNINQYYINNFFERKTFNIEYDIPSLAPPFNNCFIETKPGDYSNCIKNKSKIDIVFQKLKMAEKNQYWGIHFQRLFPPLGQKGEMFNELKKLGLKPKWNLLLSLYPENYTSPFWHHELFLDDKGKIINIGKFARFFESWGINDTLFYKPIKEGYQTLIRGNKGKPYLYIQGMGHKLIYPDYNRELFDYTDEIIKDSSFNSIYLSLGFLNCKNIKIEENIPPLKLSKKYQKKHNIPLIRYHVLKIKPQKKYRQSSIGTEKTNIEKSLHICRGHFKNFDDKPLFGKIKGTFWWDSYVRGQKEKGIVLKDYEMGKPKETNG